MALELSCSGVCPVADVSVDLFSVGALPTAPFVAELLGAELRFWQNRKQMKNEVKTWIVVDVLLNHMLQKRIYQAGLFINRTN